MGRWRRRKTNNTIENNEMLKDDDNNSTTTDTNNNDSRPNSFYESQPSSEATTQAESYVKSIYKAKKRKKQQQATFNSFDREYIRDYLSLYRSQVLISHLSKEDEEESSGEAVRIAGHDFPALNYKALQQPFIRLPSTLSGKQRKCLHDIAIDVGLFHSGAGTKSTNKRTIVLSVYSDGLQHVPDLHPPLSIPAKSCKPFFYRNDHPQQLDSNITTVDTNDSDDYRKTIKTTNIQTHRSRQTNIGKEMIQALVDQPSRCLRDAHDSIDFVEMEQEDLSTHPPPQPGAADEEGNILPWMLVDTREKMEACVKEIVVSVCIYASF
mmetsp:Transcript_16716/g.22423  ORF Transcript_16716/g.22423 Transcript_16716/m.22423 type:complete len:323 (+) Transcript_16716:134-1102(+)